MRALPNLGTSKPSPFVAAPFGGSNSLVRSFAKRAFKFPIWYSVALLTYVRFNSISMSLIFSRTPIYFIYIDLVLVIYNKMFILSKNNNILMAFFIYFI